MWKRKKKEGQGKKERAGEHHYKHNGGTRAGLRRVRKPRKDLLQRCKPIYGAHGTAEWSCGVWIRGSRCP